MAITKPPKVNPAAAEAFMAGAPDAVVSGVKPKPKMAGVRKGQRMQISHTITEEMLAQVDAMAKSLCMSRAAVINLGISQLLARGAVIEGAPKKSDETP